MSMPSPHTAENWDAASANYDANITEFTAKYADDALAYAELGSGLRTLEVAAGGGAMTLKLAPQVGELLAVDFSQGMVDLLRAKLAELGHDNVTCQQMDGMALDLPDASFDLGICQFGMMLFDNPGKGLSEMARVLKPGGRAVITAWAGPDKFEAFGLFGMAIRTGLPDMPMPPGPPPIFSLSDPERFTAMMLEAGFSEARVEHATHVMTSPSIDEFVHMFSTSAPPARALFAKIGPKGAERVQGALRKLLQDRFGDGEIVLSNTATIGVATK